MQSLFSSAVLQSKSAELELLSNANATINSVQPASDIDITKSPPTPKVAKKTPAPAAEKPGTSKASTKKQPTAKPSAAKSKVKETP